MEEGVLRRDAYFARADFYILDVLLIDLVVVFRTCHAAAVIETLNVRPGYADVNAPNHDVAFLLCIDHGLVHAFRRCLKIDDLAFAHPTRRRLTDAKELNRAIDPAFANNHANFRRANFETDHQITACHVGYSFLPFSTGMALCGVADFGFACAFAEEGALLVVGCTGIALKMCGTASGSIVSLMMLAGELVKVTGMFRCTSKFA